MLCCIAVLSHVENSVAGGIGVPGRQILIDSGISTSIQIDNSRYALWIPK